MNPSEKRQHIIRQEILKRGGIAPEKIYEEIYELFSLEEAKELIIHDFGQDFFKKNISHFSSDFFPFFCNPALALQAQQFVDFAEKKSTLSWDTFLEFQKNSPIKKMYRASVLTTEQVEEIQKNGFLSSFLRKKNRDFDALNLSLHEKINTHAYAKIDTKDSTLISVSSYPELAKFIARRFFLSQKNIPQNQEYFLYVSPLLLRECDIFSSSFFLPEKYKNSYLIHSSEKGNYNIPFEDAEYWTEFIIPAEKIEHKTIKKYNMDEVLGFNHLSL